MKIFERVENAQIWIAKLFCEEETSLYDKHIKEMLYLAKKKINIIYYDFLLFLLILRKNLYN